MHFYVCGYDNLQPNRVDNTGNVDAAVTPRDARPRLPVSALGVEQHERPDRGDEPEYPAKNLPIRKLPRQCLR